LRSKKSDSDVKISILLNKNIIVLHNNKDEIF